VESADLTPGELVTWENHPYVVLFLSGGIEEGYTHCMRLWSFGTVHGFYDREMQKKLHISRYKWNSLTRFQGVFLKTQTECVRYLSEDLWMRSQGWRATTSYSCCTAVVSRNA